MKVAVLGPSNAALEITRELINLGASVRLFWRAELHTEELIEWHRQDILIAAPWTKVTKRFLPAGVTPKDKTRFLDLFRVSFQVDPEAMITQGLIDQPEVYQKLSDEFMASLKSQLEMFEDVDVVIDASALKTRRTLGPGGPAVGESRLRAGTYAFAGDEANWSQWAREAQEIAVVGDGREAAEILCSLKTWWSKKSKRIFLVSASENPFAQFMKENHGDLNRELHSFLKTAEAEHHDALQVWEKNLAEWQELDDFVRAKKPKPEMPIPRLVIFSAHMLTGVDQLVDKSRSFLTLETIPWLTGLMQPENNQMELKTIGVDLIIGATGTTRDWSKFHGLDLQPTSNGKFARDSKGTHPEKGFFTLGAELGAQEEILSQLKTLFSPRGV
jgi:hypothetical protein